MIFKFLSLFCIIFGLSSLLFRKWIIKNKQLWFLFPKDAEDNRITEKIMNINLIFTGLFLIIAGLLTLLFSNK